MIRVPFFSSTAASADAPQVLTPVISTPEFSQDAGKSDRLEARLEALEVRLVSHAEELKSQIAGRVMRIHSRIERALRPFQPESEREKVERSTDNIVEFGNSHRSKSGTPDPLLHARNAREAMLELNETLRVTREHLEALSGSIDRMRKSVESR